MRIVDLQQQSKEEWRSGVMTRMKASAANNATQLCLFEQWCEPGHGAPTHLHAVEEVLHVLTGEADVWVGERHATVAAGPVGRADRCASDQDRDPDQRAQGEPS